MAQWRFRTRTAHVVWRGALHGLAAGAVGVAVMTAGEKLEQAVTSRPNSYVPARTFLRVPGMVRRGRGMNPAMHWGQGVLLGVLRGVMADSGLRGPWASSMFAVVRLTNDQTWENATGVGAPPWTWPRGELVIDLLHKAVYAFVTGYVADRLADRGPGERHAAVLADRRADVGPV